MYGIDFSLHWTYGVKKVVRLGCRIGNRSSDIDKATERYPTVHLMKIKRSPAKMEEGECRNFDCVKLYFAPSGFPFLQ